MHRLDSFRICHFIEADRNAEKAFESVRREINNDDDDYYDDDVGRRFTES